MIRVGITGQNGFVGRHLYNTLGLFPERYERIPFENSFFENQDQLDAFVSQCDVIVHLAAQNRNKSQEALYETNIGIVKKLIEALEKTESTPHLIFSSSTQENLDNLYGKSKKIGREMINQWAKKHNTSFTGLIIPNVFGPFGKPNYNSFIATFCYKITHNETPTIDKDAEVSLIYVGELVDKIRYAIDTNEMNEQWEIQATAVQKVSEVLSKLQQYKSLYVDQGEIPSLVTSFDYQLFNTFRSYIDLKNYFPRKFVQHTDNRGAFVELIRLGIGGQCSFSTTKPGITRGNHFHTRKIERFAVIKGKAKIQLRKIDTDEVLDYFLDGDAPAYVDMPIWYTHNISNVGNEELYTVFWINEPYSAEDSDTYVVEV